MNYRMTALSILLSFHRFIPLSVFISLCFIIFPGRSAGTIEGMSEVDRSLDAFFQEVTP